MSARRFGCIVSLLVALGGRPAAAADQWLEVKSDHFTLITDASEKDGRRTLDQFERMRWVFQKLYGGVNVDPPAPIMVVAAKDQKTFEGIEPAAYLKRGSLKLAGLFSHGPDRNYILVSLEASNLDEHPYATVYHEYTHLMFASAQEWMPLWLNEGTAEFFQNTDVRTKEVRVGQASVDDIYYLRNNTMVPLNVLLAVDHNSPYYHNEQKGSVFYAESWALVHYLTILDRQKNLNMIGDYEKLVLNQVDPVAAGEKAFGDLKVLWTNLNNYVQQAQYMEFVLNTTAAPIDESQYKVRPVPANEAAAWRADVMVRVERTDEAQKLLDGILSSDPTNAQAQATKGFIAFRTGNIDEARTWYGEAVKDGSQDFMAYYNFAQFSMRGGGDSGSAEVESALRKAIELNPRFSLAYDQLAAYYAMKHENLDEAHRLNLIALEIDPTNVNFRVNTANVLMEMERYDDALNVLKAAAGVASGTEAALVQSRIEELEQYKDARANGAQGGVVVVDEQEPGQASVKTEEKKGVVDIVTAHPTVTANAPMHTMEGVIRDVQCSLPYVIEFTVAGTGKRVNLYNNNFTTIDLSAAAGVVTGDNMNPCKDFDGKKAQVRYVESPDKTADGQVMAVELKK